LPLQFLHGKKFTDATHGGKRGMILLPHFVQLPEFKKLIFNNNHKYSKGEIMPLDIA
jgi:hypothetical protein